MGYSYLGLNRKSAKERLKVCLDVWRGSVISRQMTKVSKTERTAVSAEAVQALAEGMIADYITGKPVKETEKEKVRQEAARSMIFEYQIAPESMQADFPVSLDGKKKKKVDIAIFEAGKEHSMENLRRVIVCRPEPNLGRRSVTKIRDFDQAEKDLEEVKGFMVAGAACDWGLWTNGLERFFLKKDKRRFETRFEPNGDWPLADGTMSTPEAHSDYMRKADDTSLKRAFQRCHNFIHGNEGMPKDAAFWQFLYRTGEPRRIEILRLRKRTIHAGRRDGDSQPYPAAV